VAIVIQFGLSALTIVAAGILLTKFADAIAKITGLGGLLVGSVFLAAATSLPELTVDISAVRLGMVDLAVGDLFGSSLFNLLILAICDLLHRERGRLFSRASMAHALSATQSIAMTALAALGILLSPAIGAYSISGLSYGTLAILGAYILGLRLVFNDQKFSSQENSGSPTLSPSKLPALAKPLAGYGVAAAIILVAAPYFAAAAGKISEMTGLGGTFVGTSLVAFCTSLPELVTGIAAVRMGSFDLALGNIFGSNTFNMMLLVPLDFVSEGPILASVSPTHVVTCLSTIVITAVAVMGQLYQVEQRKRIVEPDALLVITLVIAALAAIFFLR
jgi:cation:H+ antiporter